MLRKYFSESLRLTKSNLWVFIQATVLLAVCSIFTLFLMFPALVTGLEGMYLKAWRGETVKTRDLFMFRKKIFPLLGATIHLGFKMFLSSFMSIIIIFILILLVSTVLPSALFPIISLLSSLGFFAYISWREGQFLHALNLVAEDKIKKYRKLLDGRLKSAYPFDQALLVFFYWFTFGIVFSTSGILFVLGLIVFPLIVGATAMAYVHDMGEGFSEQLK